MFTFFFYMYRLWKEGEERDLSCTRAIPVSCCQDGAATVSKKQRKTLCWKLSSFTRATLVSSRISWSQFKSYFMFKLEKVMDDFHTSTPEQRGAHNPNVEFIPFEEMKARILKIVDGYNGWAKLNPYIQCKHTCIFIYVNVSNNQVVVN